LLRELGVHHGRLEVDVDSSAGNCAQGIEGQQRLAEVIQDAEEEHLVEAAFNDLGQLVDSALDILHPRVEKSR
jgi:hypothetical protein